MKVQLRHLSDRVGRRGSALLLLAGVDIAIAIGLLTLDDYPASVRAGYAGHQALMPLNAWACLWLCVATLMIVQAFTKRDRLAFFVSAGVKLVWASCYCVGFGYYNIQRGWLQATVYFALAGVLLLISGWLENRYEIPAPTFPGGPS